MGDTRVGVPVIFRRTYARIIVRISTNSNIQLDELLSTAVAPPIPGTEVVLSDKRVPPTASCSAPSGVKVGKFLTRCVVLPLRASAPVALALRVRASKSGSSGVCGMRIPIPGKRLGTKSSCHFDTMVGNDSISVPSIDMGS